MYRSFFDSPEISKIFKRKDANNELDASVNFASKASNHCSQCLRMRECKQLGQRDRKLKTAKPIQPQQHHRPVIHYHRCYNRQKEYRHCKRRSVKHTTATMMHHDAEKIAMMNEDNVYYDYDEEQGMVVEKKHSVVIPYEHQLIKLKSRRHSNQNGLSLSSLLEEEGSLYNETDEEVHEASSEQFLNGSCLEDQFTTGPEEHYIAGSCPEEQYLDASCREEQFLDGSCPSDSAYDTTHDELTESLDRLSLINETTIAERRLSNLLEENSKQSQVALTASGHDSPYTRCRSTAICGRNCKLCHGTNKNIIPPKQVVDLKSTSKDAFERAGVDARKVSSAFESKYGNNTGGINTYKTTPESADLDRVKQNIILPQHERRKNNFDDVADAIERKTGAYNGEKMHATHVNMQDIDGEFEDMALEFNLQEAREMFSEGPHLIMLYEFKAEHEDDVSVRKGDVLLLLDDCDGDWVWVMTQDLEEGYVPKSLTMYYSMDCEDCAMQECKCSQDHHQQQQPQQQQQQKRGYQASIPSKSKTRSDNNNGQASAVIKNGIKMIAISNFDSIENGKLCVVKGEEVLVNLQDQVAPDWLWAYSPRQKIYGYIPERLVDALEVSSV
eukprot:gene14320-15809_t